MRVITIAFYIILVTFGVAFATLNVTDVSVDFYFKQVTLPLVVLMILMLLIGLMLGFILAWAYRWRRSVKKRRQQKASM